MTKYLTVSLLIFSSAITGCSGGGGDDGSETSDATYISALAGSDSTGDGSLQKPYRTVTFALSSSTTRNALKLAYGVYDASSGEQFPIILPQGKKLVADPIDVTQGNYALIRGVGSFSSDYINGTNAVALVLNNAAGIRNVAIEAPGGVALWVERASASVEIAGSAMFGSSIGITLVDNASPQINGTVIEENQQTGIELIGSAAPTFLNSIIRENAVGIVVADSAKPNFGYSSGGGGNAITGNTLCDLRHTGNGDIKTIGTTWDQDVFEFSITNACFGGANIVVDGVGAIDYQFIPPREVLIFQSQRRILLDQPAFGEVIYTQQPSFMWTSSNAHMTMVVVWEQPPAVGMSEITNTDDIHWLWHSGLNTGGAGYAQYSDGMSLQGGDITRTTLSKPLEVGRSYYWAAWEWDNAGEKIYASSPLGYFRVSN